jgi:hypothetical protein
MRAARVAIFMKQAGASAHDGLMRLELADPKGGDPEEWPEDLRIRQLPIPF